MGTRSGQHAAARGRRSRSCSGLIVDSTINM